MTDHENGGLGPEGSYYEAQERKRGDANESKWNAVYPTFISLLYLVLGFGFNLWHPGWLVFLTIPLYYVRPKNALERWSNPVMITLIFLILGFFFNLWHPAWMLFLAIPLAGVLQKKTE